MKFASILLLSAIIGASLAELTNDEPSHCPTDAKPGKFVLVPHETDCDKFYMCMGPKETLKTCRKGQLFNQQKHRCDKAENVDCEGGVTTANPTNPENPESSHCPKDNKPGKFMLVPHETDCDKFYMCMGPKETLKTCRKGQLFNKVKHRCDKAENVDCENTPTTVNPFMFEETGHCPVDADPQRLVRVAHETDCDKYYLCYNNKEKLHTCKQGKLFSEKRNHCLTADKVDCGDRTTAVPSTTTAAPETETPSFFDDERHCPENNTRVTRVAHETDCDKYWLCAGPWEKLKQCKEGKLFSARLNMCLSEHKVDCGDRTTETPTTTTETVVTTESDEIFESNETSDESIITIDCPNNHRFELFPHPDSCHKFFVCRGGEAMERECRENFVFDPIKKRCVKDEEGICEVFRNSSDNPLKPTMTPRENSCRKFVFQFQYRKYDFECKEGFWFDPQLKHCSKDRNGVCAHEKASK